MSTVEQPQPASTTTDTTAQKYGLTAEELQTLSAKCIEAKALAYCPYSRFRVGCALLTTSGTYIVGANVENAAYPVGSCAEQVAMGAAVVQGYRRGSFRAMAVATDVVPAASPCGMCRQFLREFCEPSMPIFLHDREGRYVVKTLEELLPMSFGPETLPDPMQLVAMHEKTA